MFSPYLTTTRTDFAFNLDRLTSVLQAPEYPIEEYLILEWKNWFTNENFLFKCIIINKEIKIIKINEQSIFCQCVPHKVDRIL